ncbi:hydroxymethylbilane synthase, partial [Helicobacter sp. UBA3407]
MQKLIIGTRGSVLALWQANHIKDCLEAQYKDIEVEVKIVKTKGDKILDVPLAKIGGKGLFTKELEELLLKDEIDLAVHSLKDVPVEFVEGLGLAAITKREDVRDSFLSFKYASLEELPLGARVGTTSLRRTMQISALREDLETQSLRGNVQTRLKRLQEGDFDAIILAQA